MSSCRCVPPKPFLLTSSGKTPLDLASVPVIEAKESLIRDGYFKLVSAIWFIVNNIFKQASISIVLINCLRDSLFLGMSGFFNLHSGHEVEKELLIK